MKVWFDTEFYEDGTIIDLISIGMAREDGALLYFEVEGAQRKAKKSDWLKENVLPYLSGGSSESSIIKIAKDIIEFAGEKPEFWAYYADYDWVVLCQLYGRMIDLPKGWPMFCMDVKQLAVMKGNPQLPKQNGQEHNALADAIWCKEAWKYLNCPLHHSKEGL